MEAMGKEGIYYKKGTGLAGESVLITALKPKDWVLQDYYAWRLSTKKGNTSLPG